MAAKKNSKPKTTKDTKAKKVKKTTSQKDKKSKMGITNEEEWKSKIDTTDDMVKLIRSNNIYNRSEIEWYDKFNRFGCIDPYNTLYDTREYIFFVKPDLHIYTPDTNTLNPEIASVPIFVDAKKRYPEVLESLQASCKNTKSDNTPFVNVLSNSVASTLELPGISAEYIDTSKNIYGSFITYRQSSIKSDTDFDFTLEFNDTKYLEIYMLFKLYDEYERRKFYGEITPPNKSYITNKIIHDQMAVYKLIVGEDGETIIYWAKLTGVYPISVPRDSFSSLDKDGIKFAINFKCSFVEDMDPIILQDFNSCVKSKLSSYKKDIPIYDNKNNIVNGEWCNVPYIIYDNTLTINAKTPYKLRWR